MTKKKQVTITQCQPVDSFLGETWNIGIVNISFKK